MKSNEEIDEEIERIKQDNKWLWILCLIPGVGIFGVILVILGYIANADCLEKLEKQKTQGHYETNRFGNTMWVE